MNLNLKKNGLIFISLLIFFATRLLIIHGYDVYWTDVGLYHEAAFVGVKGGFRAYHDYWWPYPPLTLPVVYLPILIGSTPWAYRMVFHYEMFCFEVISLVYIILFLKNRFNVSKLQIAIAVMVYSLLGLLVGHLIYDRLDIVISAVFMASVYHFTSQTKQIKNRLLSYFFYLAGALFKLLPLLWWPVYVISECFAGNSEKGNEIGMLERFDISKQNVKRALFPFLIIVIPFIIIMFTYNYLTFNQMKQKGMFTFMSEHGERGIQMESTWATPLMVCNAIRKSQNRSVPFPLVTNFGAQHFDGKSVNKYYLILSKYIGFISLALIYIAFFLYFLMKKEKRDAVEDQKWIMTFLLFAVFFIISTQRVLSSQYIIWSMPGMIVLIFSSEKIKYSLLSLTVFIFLFSYIGFDLGYENYIEFDPWIVAAVSVRNMLLIILTALLFFKLIPKQKIKC